MNIANVTPDSSENSDMLIDPPERDDQQKGQKSSETTGNHQNQCNMSFARPEEFSIFADLNSVPGKDHVNKCRSVNFQFRNKNQYVGNRIINYRGRNLIKAYF